MENIQLKVENNVGVITYESNSEQFEVRVNDVAEWSHAFLMWTTDPSLVHSLITKYQA